VIPVLGFNWLLRGSLRFALAAALSSLAVVRLLWITVICKLFRGASSLSMSIISSPSRSGADLTIKLEPSAITRSVSSSNGLISGITSDAGRLNKGMTSVIVSTANELLMSRVTKINGKSFLFKVNLKF
jgi:hypothetical protein